MNDILDAMLDGATRSIEQPGTRVRILTTMLAAVSLLGVVRLYPVMDAALTEEIGLPTTTSQSPAKAAASAYTSVHAVIKSSVYDAVAAGGLDPSLAVRLRDIFGSKVDFRRDIRAGDWFGVIYAPVNPSAATTGPGELLAAEISVSGHTYRAFLFQEAGAAERYFTAAGRSLQQGILRAPLNYSHISSPFNLHRMDPVLHVIRPHYGVDYAAPMGTPVHAASDGRVRFVGVDAGYGNLVVIRSFGMYETYYAHLKNFARGLHAGSRVQQGQVIGYVGESGEATGPHLHYGIMVSGTWCNPLTAALPDGRSLPKVALARYQMQIEPLIAELSEITAIVARTAPAADKSGKGAIKDGGIAARLVSDTRQ